MSNLSTNTLFHYTTEIEYLEDILQNGFSPRMSIETITNESDELNVAFPLKCFCDIPMSQVNMHMKTYGHYAIGLNKDWGIKNNVSPLLYFCKDSLIIKSIFEIGNLISEREDITEKDISSLGRILLYAKPYTGRFFRNGHFLEDEVRFYDEREWRYVPPIEVLENEEIDLLIYDEDEDFYNMEKMNDINIFIASKDYLKLKFEPKDIKYIIVKNDDEVIRILDILTKCFSKFPYDDIQILGTRVITSQQIHEDF